MIHRPLTTRTSRNAFTLVELLVTITIISILASLILGVAALAGETAREARTKQLITRIHTLLMDHYDSFRNRRIEVHSTSNTATPFTGQRLAAARLDAMRNVLRMELPDQWSDIIGGPIESNAPNRNLSAPQRVTLRRTASGQVGSNQIRPVPYGEIQVDFPAMARIFFRRYHTGISLTATPEDIRANEGAECLYLIVTLACGDGEARSQFNQNDIGDTDGDGALEFVDGWGKPIEFVRWPLGYISPIQYCANYYSKYWDDSSGTQEWLNVADKDHDPFDVFRVDRIAYRLTPLIVSRGRDEELGLFPNVTGQLRDTRNWTEQLDPFAKAEWPQQTGADLVLFAGSPIAKDGQRHQLDAKQNEAVDNITNHLIEYEKRR